MASTAKQTVHVRLEVINEEESGESHAYRYLTLEAPSYSIRIGRGSRSGSKDLYPADNNAWFDSRVMSREHAVLKAQPDTKTLTIQDVGSMHGTYVDDVKLSKYQPKTVHDGDAIVFGTEVSRGPDTFPALEIDVFFSFDGDEDIQGDMTSTHGSYARERPHITRNSFSVPDYDSEEDYDSEMEVTSIPPPPPPPRDAAVPESVISNGGSFVSDEDNTPYEPWNRTYCNTFESKENRGELKPAPNPIDETLGSASAAKTNISPADVIMWSKCCGDAPSLNFITSGKAHTSQAPTEGDQPTTSPANVQSSVTVQSTARPAAVVINTSANGADEQSESDYGDDISADLFDEDFDTDDYQQADRQPDTSSFSSQSPILTSLPSKTELAAHQSTIKESTKTMLPQSPILAAAPVERRAPSPSDAAMPKAKQAYPSFQYTPPRFTTATQLSHYDHHFGSSSALPTTSRDTSFMRSYGYTSSQDVQNVQDTYPQPYYPLDVSSLYYDPPALDWTWGAPQIPSKPATAAPNTLEPDPTPVPAPASSFVTIKTTPRVAIKDLVDGAEIVEEFSQKRRATPCATASPILHLRAELSTSSGIKRKADQISEADKPEPIPVSMLAADGGVESSLSQEQQDAQVVKTLTSTTNSQSQTDIWGPLGMIDSALPAPLVADAQANTIDERPKKKARSDFYKYAAGAAGGIAIGAVGVVAALVTLPPDFFV